MRILLAIAVVLTGCATMRGGGGSHTPCVHGPVPEIGRSSANESYGLLRRELDRAGDRTSVAASRIIEEVPRLIIDASDMGGEPDCHYDMVMLAREEVLDGGKSGDKITFSRRTIARVRAAGRAADVSGVFEDKAKFLIAIAELRDDQISDYKLERDEPGPPPPKSLLRYLAIGYLSRSSLYANSAIGGPWIRDRAAKATDARERLLFRYHVKHVDDARLAAELDAAADPVALELAFMDLRHADPGPAVQRVLAAHGAVPVAKGIPGAELDLWRAALSVTLPQGRHGANLARQSAEWDPWKDWLEREPAGGTVPAVVAHERLKQFDKDLERMKELEPRCIVLGLIADWTPASLGEARFTQMMAPAMNGPAFHNFYEARCRISAALAMDAAPRELRAQLAAKLLRADVQFEAYDPNHDKFDSLTVIDNDGHSYRALAAHALVLHPEWDTALSAETQELAMIPLDGKIDELIYTAQPALSRMLVALAATNPAAAKKIVGAWLDSSLEAVRDKEVHAIYPGEVAEARIYAMAAVAEQLGMSEEVIAQLIAIASTPLPNDSARGTHPRIVEAASIVLASMKPASP